MPAFSLRLIECRDIAAPISRGTTSGGSSNVTAAPTPAVVGRRDALQRTAQGCGIDRFTCCGGGACSGLEWHSPVASSPHSMCQACGPLPDLEPLATSTTSPTTSSTTSTNASLQCNQENFEYWSRLSLLPVEVRGLLPAIYDSCGTGPDGLTAGSCNIWDAITPKSAVVTFLTSGVWTFNGTFSPSADDPIRKNHRCTFNHTCGGVMTCAQLQSGVHREVLNPIVLAFSSGAAICLLVMLSMLFGIMPVWKSKTSRGKGFCNFIIYCVATLIRVVRVCITYCLSLCCALRCSLAESDGLLGKTARDAYLVIGLSWSLFGMCILVAFFLFTGP